MVRGEIPQPFLKENNMTVELGIGMFVYNMIALCIGAILVYIVINRNNKE